MIKVGITQGDINGIGYEVIIKSLMDNRINDICTPIIYGSPKVAAYHRKALNLENFNLNNIKTPNEANPKRSNIINVMDDNVRVELGKITEMGGQGSYLSLKHAVEDLKYNKIDALVTAPIHKSNIQSENFTFPGHTEFLKQQFNADEVAMFMVSNLLRVAVLTGHIPVSQIPQNVTVEKILKKLKIISQSLLVDFGIRKPRIAVLGLNPHAGDDGLLGTEDRDIIAPAIEKARNEGLLAFGPFAADGFFGSDSFTKFDAILAMYHDQGLIPFKTLAFDEGVNYTAGLSIIRTSPGHGTGFDLAGKGTASENSFRNALYLACDIYKNRQMHKDITKNPLKPADLSALE
jgi:4-hydroxythreonine-4-phosphate dehydrogenase